MPKLVGALYPLLLAMLIDHSATERRSASWVKIAIRGMSTPEKSSSSVKDIRRRQFGCVSHCAEKVRLFGLADDVSELY